MNWRRLFRPPSRSPQRIRAEVEEELAFHLDARARQYEAQGLAPAAARSRAEAEFGNLPETRRRLTASDARTERRLRVGTWLAEAAHDARIATRQARRAPLITALAVLMLALGIGASAAVYSVVRGVLLTPLPYPDGDGLVVLRQFDRVLGQPVYLAPLNFVDVRDRVRSLTHAAIAEPYGNDLTGAGDPVRLQTWNVTTGFFDALGQPPLHGRTPTPDEFATGAPVIVLGHAVWQTRFAGDPALVGRTLQIDGAPRTVIGILGPDFRFPSAADAWLPRPLPTARANRVSTYLRGVARLAPGATLAQAQRELDAVAAQLATDFPQSNRNTGLIATPLHEYLTGSVRTALLVLLTAAVLVQLIGCANVASLLLARALARRRELAVRRALGAGRGRMIRQFLAEGAALAGAGLLLGTGVAVAGVALLRRLAPADLPRLENVQLDGGVLLFAAGLAAAAALAAGVIPALHSWRREEADGLRETPGSRTRRRALGALVTAEITLAFVLLIGAGLLLRSWVRVVNEDLGFRPGGSLALTMHFWDRAPDGPRQAAFIRDLETRLAALPGVRAVAAANSVPLSAHGSEMDPPYLVEGEPAPASGDEPTAILTMVTPRWFDAMGIRLQRGRAFRDADDAAAPPVVVVGAALARRHFGDRDPVGHRLLLLWRGQRIGAEIVGVVADVRHERPDAPPRPEIYVPHAQRPFASMTLVLRADGDLLTLLPAVQQAVWAQAPGLTFDGVEPLAARLSEILAPRRFVLALVSGFAVLALVLALGGIVGALAFMVTQRTTEIGVRMALGAHASGVVRLVVREGVALAAAGVAVGALLAVPTSRFLEALLYGVTAADPLTWVVQAALLIGCGALAAWLPARRAARVDPVTAIRGGG